MVSKVYEIIEIKLNGIQCLLHYSGIIYIPKINAVVISDIHFEKSSAVNSLQSSSIPLPPFDTIDILIKIKKLLECFEPKKIIFLGDTFHNLASAEIISEKNQNLIQDFSNSYFCIWIKGNHDLDKPSWLNVTPLDEHDEMGIKFRHITKFEKYEISGHYHLKAKVKTKDKSIVGKCFLYNYKIIIMPSFGVFTGGLYLTEFLKSLSISDHFGVGFIYKNKIYNYNLKAVIK